MPTIQILPENHNGQLFTNGLLILTFWISLHLWFGRLEQATGLAFRFVIGRSKDAKKMLDLEKEVEKYKDFMLIEVEEEYLKLPYKT